MFKVGGVVAAATKVAAHGETLDVIVAGLSVLFELSMAEAIWGSLVDVFGVVDAAESAATRFDDVPEVRDEGAMILWFLSDVGADLVAERSCGVSEKCGVARRCAPLGRGLEKGAAEGREQRDPARRR